MFFGSRCYEFQDQRPGIVPGRDRLQFAIRLTVAFFVYQIGTMITAGNPVAGFMPGILVTAAISREAG